MLGWQTLLPLNVMPKNKAVQVSFFWHVGCGVSHMCKGGAGRILERNQNKNRSDLGAYTPVCRAWMSKVTLGSSVRHW